MTDKDFLNIKSAVLNDDGHIVIRKSGSPNDWIFWVTPKQLEAIARDWHERFSS